MSEIVYDITPIFDELLTNIETLSYEELSKTKVFSIISQLVENDSQFSLRIYGDMLYFDNVNDLFNESLFYCEEHQLEFEAKRLQYAIQKMNFCVDIENISETFSKSL